MKENSFVGAMLEQIRGEKSELEKMQEQLADNSSSTSNYMDDKFKTGTIMDASSSGSQEVNNELLAAQLQQLMLNRKPSVKDNHIGRNDPCPCGSGKKYKNCCLSSGKFETYSKQ